MTDFQQLLQRCTIRIDASGSRGTGFFVAPQLILTCHHVVGENNSVDVFWKVTQQNYTATVIKVYEFPIDLALLKLDTEIKKNHPCVELTNSPPNSQDKLHIFGYPRDEGVDYPDGDSVTFDYGGEAFKENIKLYNLQSGRILGGFSGSPLLNLNTGKVVGMVHLSHDTTSDLGGRAVSCEVIFNQFPQISSDNYTFHQRTQMPEAPDTNPFQYGSSVPPQGFYGREKAILHLKNRIGASSPNSVNIVGFRRNGKTSLLRYIKESPSTFFLDSQKPLIVNLDLQSKKFHQPKGIVKGLRREITRLTGNQPWKNEDNDDDFDFDFEDALIRLVNEGYRLIVMLDEFEYISQYLNDFQDWGGDWRAKASAGLLTMVISSKRPLQEIYDNVGVGSPFGNIFSLTILGGLETQAWQSLVRNGFQVKPHLLNYEWIDKLTGGLPFYVQMAGSILWQYEDFSQAEREFDFQAKPRFQELWDDLTAQEKLALRHVLNLGNIPQPSREVMDNLKYNGVLRADNRIFSSAFADFIISQKIFR